jgi:hypothetical protein
MRQYLMKRLGAVCQVRARQSPETFKIAKASLGLVETGSVQVDAPWSQGGPV